MQLSRTRFVLMEKRLFAIMTIGALITLTFGLLLLWANPGLFKQGWFHAKLGLLARSCGVSLPLPSLDAETG